MLLQLTHQTRYDYSEPVTFAPHALYLRPRETSRQRLQHFALEISPAARRIATNDPLDNALDWAFFDAATPVATLEFRTELRVETLDANPFDFFLKPSASAFPFDYEPEEKVALAPCLTLRADSPVPEMLRGWVEEKLPSPPKETVPFLVALNGALRNSLVYNRREEHGIQPAAQTLALGGGSCRDYAVLLIELCRALGLAARFVSGYLYEPAAPDAAADTPASANPPPSEPAMHAWAEVYLPGAGWRGLDATRGIFCDDAFIPVAHAAVAENVSPIQGSFYGPPTVTSRLTTRLMIEKP